MAAIPFSLVGILPAHAAMGAFFTATSMIGFIAGAGIVVRNSIILVDFIELRVRDGMPLEEAVIDAGAVRFRPMALTAAAVVVGLGGHPVRPDLPGPGHLADGRRGGVAPAVASHRAGVVLHDGQAPGAEGAGLDAGRRRGRKGLATMWQYPPRNILVAVDFGDASARALRVAAALAAQHGSAITALHAETLEVPPYFTHDQLKEVERNRAQARRDAQRYLEQFVASVGAVGGRRAGRRSGRRGDPGCRRAPRPPRARHPRTARAQPVVDRIGRRTGGPGQPRARPRGSRRAGTHARPVGVHQARGRRPARSSAARRATTRRRSRRASGARSRRRPSRRSTT